MTVTNPTLGGSRRTLLAGGLGFALTASSSANVRTDRAATVHELPLLLSDYGLVFTWITVQGRPVRTLVDTGSASGKLQFHVFAALAEFERNLIRERTLAGLSAARARGRMGGRKPKLSGKQIREIKALLTDPAAQVTELAKRYGVSRTTIYKRIGVVQPVKI
jgi:hypothetical protein